MDHSHIGRRDFLAASLSLSAAGVAGAAGAVLGGRSAGAAKTPPAAKQAEAVKQPTGTGWEENEVIQKARAAALDILKPSKKELEHGLALHAESVVFDTYGFAPRAAGRQCLGIAWTHYARTRNRWQPA